MVTVETALFLLTPHATIPCPKLITGISPQWFMTCLPPPQRYLHHKS